VAERGRAPGFRMSDECRVKIQNSNILNALMEHVLGLREMLPTQVTAAIALLKKVLPDLQAVQLSGPEDGPIQVERIGGRERLARLISQGNESGESETIPSKPH
jgi:hypothetical protein